MTEEKKPRGRKKVETPTEKKYRYQFKSWKEYNEYKGPKG